jgi:site-specific recombinase XerC
MTEQEIQEKGYANPDALVSTQWVAEHLDDTENVRIVESDEDVLLYDIGHVPNSVKIDWVEDLNDPLMRDYLDPEHFANLMAELGISPDTTVLAPDRQPVRTIPTSRLIKGELRKKRSARTVNMVLGHFKHFCKWLVKARRMDHDPTLHLGILNVRTDRKRVRRALTDDEAAAFCDGEIHARQRGLRRLLGRVGRGVGEGCGDHVASDVRERALDEPGVFDAAIGDDERAGDSELVQVGGQLGGGSLAEADRRQVVDHRNSHLRLLYSRLPRRVLGRQRGHRVAQLVIRQVRGRAEAHVGAPAVGQYAAIREHALDGRRVGAAQREKARERLSGG